MTALASFWLLGFAAVVSATAIAVAGVPDTRAEGRAKMIDAEYQLGTMLKR